MKMKQVLIWAILAVLTFGAVAAEQLAIAEPVGKGGVSSQEVEALWGMLEASVGGDYQLISRSALQAILTEAGLTESSGLVDLNSRQKAQLGKVKGVNYILVSTVGKLGNRLSISLMVLNASTGEIDPMKRTSELVGSLDELADKLKGMLNQIGLGRGIRRWGRSALLRPVVKVHRAPDNFAETFSVMLEEALLSNKLRLQNLQSVTQILRKNGIGDLNEVEPSMYSRIGELLQVDYLIMPTVSRFECTSAEVEIKVTRRKVISRIGDMAGNVRIIDAQTGEAVGSLAYNYQVDFDAIDGTETWTWADYENCLLQNVMPVITSRILGWMNNQR